VNLLDGDFPPRGSDRPQAHRPPRPLPHHPACLRVCVCVFFFFLWGLGVGDGDGDGDGVGVGDGIASVSVSLLSRAEWKGMEWIDTPAAGEAQCAGW
jgi:hypothetical protein